MLNSSAMIKKLTHRIALRLEGVADRLFHRTSAGRQIDAYVGYATPDQIVLRGRVLSELRHATPQNKQSELTNLLQMFGMFLTDEVRYAAVRCREVSTQTDEEGYFTLVLPRGGQTGWHTENVFVEGRQEAVECPVLISRKDAQYLVISDIDDTMLETGAYSLLRNLYTSFTGNAKTRRIFPDAVKLMDTLSKDGLNPVFYVSSSPWNMHDFLQDIFENTQLVRGPMFLRDLGISPTKFITEGHGNHKGASIDTILNANPELPAILLGDTGQHDAKIYCEAVKRHKGRILAVGLRTPGPGLDSADQSDLLALKDTGVEVFAAPTFVGFFPSVVER